MYICVCSLWLRRLLYSPVSFTLPRIFVRMIPSGSSFVDLQTLGYFPHSSQLILLCKGPQVRVLCSRVWSWCWWIIHFLYPRLLWLVGTQFNFLVSCYKCIFLGVMFTAILWQWSHHYICAKCLGSCRHSIR